MSDQAEQGNGAATTEAMQALLASLTAATVKSDGRMYPSAEDIAAWSDERYIQEATDALAASRDGAGEKSQLTKYRKRLRADALRRATVAATDAS